MKYELEQFQGLIGGALILLVTAVVSPGDRTVVIALVLASLLMSNSLTRLHPVVFRVKKQEKGRK